MASIRKKTQGILYILTAAFGFSVMTLFVKLAGDLPAFQKSFFRNFVALLFIAAGVPSSARSVCSAISTPSAS